VAVVVVGVVVLVVVVLVVVVLVVVVGVVLVVVVVVCVGVEVDVVVLLHDAKTSDVTMRQVSNPQIIPFFIRTSFCYNTSRTMTINPFWSRSLYYIITLVLLQIPTCLKAPCRDGIIFISYLISNVKTCIKK